MVEGPQPEERQTYTTLYPKEIGATDGLPSDVRDNANRTALTQELNLIQEGNRDEGFPGDTDETVYKPCVGENDEVAQDGRYTLFYYVNSPAPATEHTRMVRKRRSQLPSQDYEVTSYREFKSTYASAIFRAWNKKNDYQVEAETVGSGKTKPQRFSFAVRTPCLLPPGAEQQKF
ncbi:hypothetical protein ACFY2T_33005 [Streptomyces sp. NPDC001260]|uniref:hypothetical protein n=1 Tax=Streptomyces sp. NPDC001260 TaxID=3364551 RepID=UPI00368AA983